jgi:hypothetical protein
MPRSNPPALVAAKDNVARPDMAACRFDLETFVVEDFKRKVTVFSCVLAATLHRRMREKL